MRRHLLTMGYGNNPPQRFLERITAMEIDFLLDVRRPNARSWNNRYWKANIGNWICDSDTNAIWLDYGALANTFNTLCEYRKWLRSDEGKTEVASLADDLVITLDAKMPCLLCAELKPFVLYGAAQVACCHRVYIAFALEWLIQDNPHRWTVMHI